MNGWWEACGPGHLPKSGPDPKWHPDLIINFLPVHTSDRQTDRQMGLTDV